jgi:hypothetical protein
VHDGSGLFTGVPNRFEAARYHSLLVAAESLPPALTVTARTREGIPMALRHATQPVEGMQFHPESVLTIHGTAIMRNFVQAVGRWRTGSSWTQIRASQPPESAAVHHEDDRRSRGPGGGGPSQWPGQVPVPPRGAA